MADRDETTSPTRHDDSADDGASSVPPPPPPPLPPSSSPQTPGSLPAQTQQQPATSHDDEGGRRQRGGGGERVVQIIDDIPAEVACCPPSPTTLTTPTKNKSMSMRGRSPGKNSTASTEPPSFTSTAGGGDTNSEGGISSIDDSVESDDPSSSAESDWGKLQYGFVVKKSHVGLGEAVEVDGDGFPMTSSSTSGHSPVVTGHGSDGAVEVVVSEPNVEKKKEKKKKKGRRRGEGRHGGAQKKQNQWSRTRIIVVALILLGILGVVACLLALFVGPGREEIPALASSSGGGSASSSSSSSSDDGDGTTPSNGAAPPGGASSGGGDGTTSSLNGAAPPGGADGTGRPTYTTQDGHASDASDVAAALPPESASMRPTATPTTTPTTAAPTNAPTLNGYETFSFYVMGDTPYSDDEATILAMQLPQMTIDAVPAMHDEGSMFVVHVGDIMRGNDDRESPCFRWKYQLVEHMLTTMSPVPPLMLPGDNDWTDCDEPNVGWERWEDSFGELEWTWAGANDENNGNAALFESFPHTVTRQDVRKENFAFRHGGVLFVGLNMVEDSYSDSERENRMEDNAAWVREWLGGWQEGAAAKELRALCLFGHAWYSDFFDYIEDDLRELDVPVVYFHGDDHEYDVRDRFSFPFWEVSLDQGAIAPPVRVTVVGTTDRSDLAEQALLEKEDANDDDDLEWLGDFIVLDRRGGTDNGPLIVGLGSDTLLDLGGDICDRDTPCGLCEGDCDDDRDCLPGLECFMRDEYEPVPGCGGLGSEGSDYCYDPLVV